MEGSWSWNPRWSTEADPGDHSGKVVMVVQMDSGEAGGQALNIVVVGQEEAAAIAVEVAVEDEAVGVEGRRMVCTKRME